MLHINVKTQKGTKVADVACHDSSCYLGKDDDCLIKLHGWMVGKRHAELHTTEAGVFVKDLGTKSGTKVNGQTIDDYGPLNDSDSIEINSYIIRIKGSTEFKKNSDAAEPSIESRTDPGRDSSEDDFPTEGPMKELRIKVHKELLKQMDLRRVDVNSMTDEQLRVFTEDLIQKIILQFDDIPEFIDRSDLCDQVLNEAVGLGPLESLLAMDDVSEIMVNAADEIFYEKKGKTYKSSVSFTDDRAVLSAIERIVTPLGRRIDESSPAVDARLKDGSRVNAVIPPIALKGPCITIRKFMKDRLWASDLVKFGTFNDEMVKFLEMAVVHKQNIIISGGTGSGKTTLLNVLSNFIPETERIITVEDAAELKLYQDNLISLEARPANQEGKGAVPIRELVKNCLRMRPDRIVVGECRGGETLDMLQAMNTGHDGSLTTAHANSPRDCISRLEVMVMMAGMDLPVLAIREQISSAVNIIVQQTRFACGTRKVISVCEVSGVEGNRIQLGEIFRFQQTGFDSEGKVKGKFITTGVVPQFYEDLAKRGLDVDREIFAEGRELS